MRYLFKGKDENNKWKKGYVEATSRREGLILLEELYSVKTPIFFKESKEIPIVEKTKKQFEKTKNSFSKLKRNPKEQPPQFNITDDNLATMISKLEKSDNKGINIILNALNSNDNDYEEESLYFDNEKKLKVEKKERRKENKKEIDWSIFQAENVNKVSKNLRNVKVKPKEILNFTNQLALSLNSGVSLTESLSLLVDIVQNKKFKAIIKDIEEDVHKGNKFSSSLAKYPTIFNHLYIALIQVGETGGNIGVCLEDISSFKKKELEILRSVKSAIVYPKIVLGLLGIMSVAGSMFLIPMFRNMFAEQEAELPKLTQAIFFMADKMIFLVGGFILVMMITKIIRRKIPKIDILVKHQLDKISLKIPVVSKVVITLNMFFFSSTLKLMIKNGIRLTDSLELVKQTMPNTILREEVQEALENIIRGGALSDALKEQKYFAELLSAIISIGEKTGEMEKVLEGTTIYYDGELTEQMDVVMRSVEPVFMVLLGLLIGPVIIGIYLPILDLSSGANLKL